MMLPQLLALTLALAPSLASAALFPANGLVKMLDHKKFKDAMKQNLTFAVAFTAPWCGHCKNMAPEWSQAALGLWPLVPLYAVDCDQPKNKRLCADQGVQGFPTIKLWPRGKHMKPITYDAPERTASAFFYWASRAIPIKIEKVTELSDIPVWAKKHASKPRALLMNKTNKKPLLWTVLGNKYKDEIVFGRHRDKKGRDSVAMGFEAGGKDQPKVLIYPAGETKPVQYKGLMKFDSLSKFFDSVIDGTADLTVANEEAAAEEFAPNEEELEIERKQEAEMLKIAHGGFSDLIDFEKAVKDGTAKDFHGSNGFPGMMGVPPEYKKNPAGEESGANEKPGGSKGAVKEGSLAQGEMPRTGDAGQVVLEAKTDTAGEQPKTAEPESSMASTVSVETPTETPHVKDEL